MLEPGQFGYFYFGMNYCSVCYNVDDQKLTSQHCSVFRSSLVNLGFLYFLLFKSSCLYSIDNSFKIKLYKQYKLFEGGLTHELCRR